MFISIPENFIQLKWNSQCQTKGQDLMCRRNSKPTSHFPTLGTSGRISDTETFRMRSWRLFKAVATCKLSIVDVVGDWELGVIGRSSLSSLLYDCAEIWGNVCNLAWPIGGSGKWLTGLPSESLVPKPIAGAWNEYPFYQRKIEERDASVGGIVEDYGIGWSYSSLTRVYRLGGISRWSRVLADFKFILVETQRTLLSVATM